MKNKSLPRRISVINYKGGTGKTTTAVHLAHGLALAGKSVLMIDTDPQGSSSYHLGVQSGKSIYDLLVMDASVDECRVEARPGLDIICSNERVFPAELALGGMNNREMVLKSKLDDVQNYDFIIIDCAPSINLINQNALLFSNEIYLPVSMEYMSLVGIKQLLNNIKLIHKIFDHQLEKIRVVPTFYEAKKKKSSEILVSLNRVFPNQLLSPIRSSAALSEAPGFSQTAFEYAPKSTGAVDYTKLVNEVLANG